MKRNKRILKREERGITLIALVITIIVLLILAGVSIAMLTGENGILTQAQNAKNKTEEVEEKEKIQLAITEAQLGDNGYQKLTEENLQKEINEQFGDGAVRVYPNEKNAFSFLFQNKETNYRLEKDGTLNKIDIALKINNVEEFRTFMNEVNSGNTYESQYVYLLENIDLSSETWDVIGSYTDDGKSNTFAGIFEGNNRTISGLNINEDKEFVGLFAYNTGTIRDVILESGAVTGIARVGGIVAVNDGMIENCHNKGVTVNASGIGIGGIVGRCNGNVMQCSNLANINGSGENSSFVGGIAGVINYNTISYCYNAGNITGMGKNIENGGTYVGGIVGQAIDGKILNCYNSGGVKSEYINGGGIVGQVTKEGRVSNCYNIGIVSNQGVCIGNIAGSAYNEVVIENCYFSKEICNLEGVERTNGMTSIETIEKTISYMKISDFVDDLNKNEEIFVIDIGINDGYPILKWQVE